jgi:hypothetical protein
MLKLPSRNGKSIERFSFRFPASFYKSNFRTQKGVCTMPILTTTILSTKTKFLSSLIRKPWMRSLLVLAVVALVLASMTGVAGAAPASEEFAGQGRLACEGVGVAILNMTGHLDVAADRGANAFFKGVESLHAVGKGRRIDRGDWTYLYGWKGEVNAEGRDFYAHLTGNSASFVAIGRGRARVKGHGACNANGVIIKLTPVFQEISLESPSS